MCVGGGGVAGELEGLEELLLAAACSVPSIQVLSKGYILSSTKIRDRLLVSEWELARKPAAMRRWGGTGAAGCCDGI